MIEVPDEVYGEALKAMHYAQQGGDWRVAVAVAYRAGREAAASDIADHPGPDPSPANPAWWAGYAEAQCDAAAIARGGRS